MYLLFSSKLRPGDLGSRNLARKLKDELVGKIQVNLYRETRCVPYIARNNPMYMYRSIHYYNLTFSFISISNLHPALMLHEATANIQPWQDGEFMDVSHFVTLVIKMYDANC